MEQQRARSRSGSKMAGDVFTDMDLDLNVPKTKFLGYDMMMTDAKVLRIFNGQESVDHAEKGAEVRIVLDQTPFYAESGGQVGDTGILKTGTATVNITDTRKLDDIFLHNAVINNGKIAVGDTLFAKVDKERRMAIMRNHTATHLLQAALRKVLGEHVQQQGSAVDNERLRFDFTHPQSLTEKQKAEVEEEVNRMVKDDVKVEKTEVTMDEARKKGALAFFAEKYGQKVRVVHVPGCSTELCGGTHLENTGEIKLFKISSESAIAQGIRRIEAVTASNAEVFLELLKQREQETFEIQKKKETEKEDLEEKFQHFKNEELPKFLSQTYRLPNNAQMVINIVPKIEIEILRKLSDVAKQMIKSGVVIFGTSCDGRATMLVSVTDDLIKQGIKAGDIVKESAPIMEGSGGGKPQFAQAGGKNVSKLKEAIEKAKKIVIEKLS
jgi:alanyl-tRNA synthetase